MFNNYYRDRKKFITCFSLTILTIGIFSFKSLTRNSALSLFNKGSESALFTLKEDTPSASILATGDVMVYNAQIKSQYDASTDSFNFNNNFKHVKKYVEKSDYSMANLETTFTDPKIYKYSSAPKFNSPGALADGLKYAGFDLLSTANNHCYDKGDLSISGTISTLNEKNLDVVGTRENKEDDEFIVKNINDMNIGITSYTAGKVVGDDKYLNNKKISNNYKDNINIFSNSNVDEAFKTINSTLEKMKNTDLQIVYLHWGDSFAKDENKFQEELAQKLCDANVDVILGSHPHVIQSVKTIKSSNNKNETVIAYSLGNFLSNQDRKDYSMYTEDGLMIDIEISKSKDNKEAKVEKVTAIPTYQNKYLNKETNKYVFEIIPLVNKDDINNIDNLNHSYLKQSFENTASKIKTSNLINLVENPFK